MCQDYERMDHSLQIEIYSHIQTVSVCKQNELEHYKLSDCELSLRRVEQTWATIFVKKL